MSKRPLAAAAAFLLLAALTACSDDDSPTAARDTSDESSEQPVDDDGAPCLYVNDGAGASREVDPPADRAAYVLFVHPDVQRPVAQQPRPPKIGSRRCN